MSEQQGDAVASAAMRGQLQGRPQVALDAREGQRHLGIHI
jgi:hypothetical protein